MLSDEIRTRLARLHAGRNTGSRRDALSASDTCELILPSEEPAGGVDLLAHGRTCENASGTHLRFRRALAELWPGADETVAALAGRTTAASQRHAELAALADWLPHGTVFLDLETCGFAGSMVFLAGLVWHDDGLVLDQLFARTYAEERAVLQTLWQIAAANRVLVTFNGKSFDWPMVHDRSTRHRLGRDLRGQERSRPPAWRPTDPLGRDDARPELVHCDLLHHARRRWKRVLPNCRLQTLERHVCGRVRHDDLPGALVPVAYREFVRGGGAGQIRGILKHNALDLVTLAQLACRLLASGALGQERLSRAQEKGPRRGMVTRGRGPE